MGNKNIGGAILDDLKALPKKILKPYYKNGKLNANKIAIDGIPFVIIFYVINKYVQAAISADGGDMLDKCVKAFSLIFQVKPYFAPSFKLTPLICGIGAGVAFKLFMNSRKKNNPFAYIHTEQDVLKFVNTLIANTKGEGAQSGEDFWVKAERLLFTAYVAYIVKYCKKSERYFVSLLAMIDASETREEDEDFENAIDLMFKDIEFGNDEEGIEADPDSFAVRQYHKYKLAAGKTAKSILVSCGARLAPFDIKEVREITAYDELDLGDIGRRKTALFVIISDTDDSLNFLVSIMYTQLFNLLCTIADDEYHGKLPVHVRCILDEFANIGQIPKFDKLIATIRSREISASIILQSKAQLKSIYKDNAETIEGNCDTFLFLGGKEKSTLKDLSEVLGKETIDTYNTSDTRGTSQSYGLNYQKLGRELMSQDRLALMDGGKCILQVRGVRPFFSDKVDITANEMYKELSDFDKKNQFDIEKYVSEYGKPKFSKII